MELPLTEKGRTLWGASVGAGLRVLPRYLWSNQLEEGGSYAMGIARVQGSAEAVDQGECVGKNVYTLDFQRPKCSENRIFSLDNLKWGVTKSLQVRFATDNM